MGYQQKMPLQVVIKLEDRKKVGDVWAMELLRQLLKQYIEVQESAQRHVVSAKGHSQAFRSQRQSERQYIGIVQKTDKQLTPPYLCY